MGSARNERVSLLLPSASFSPSLPFWPPVIPATNPKLSRSIFSTSSSLAAFFALPAQGREGESQGSSGFATSPPLPLLIPA